MNKTEIMRELEAYYPDKKIRSISTEHRKLYDYINKLAQKQGVSCRALLNDWGFEYHFGGIQFDPAIATKLHDEFNVSNQKFVVWTGYTKQMISHLMNGYQNDIFYSTAKMGNWSGASLSAEETALAAEMVTNRQFESSRDRIRVILGNNCAGKVYLVVIGFDSIKVYFEDTVPSTLMDTIRLNRLDILTAKEVEFVTRGSFAEVMLVPHFLPHSSMQSAFYAAAYNKGLSADEFSIYLTGCPCAIALVRTTDERIIKFLKANQVGDKVYLSGHPANQWLRSLASRRNISLYQLVSLYGFKLADKGFSRRNPVFFR